MAAQAKDINMSSDDCTGPLYQHVSGNSMVHGHQHGSKQWQRSQYMAFGGNKGHGHQHGPMLQQGHGPQQGPGQQYKSLTSTWPSEATQTMDTNVTSCSNTDIYLYSRGKKGIRHPRGLPW